MKKSIFIITVAQILMWGIFSIFVYIEKTTPNEVPLVFYFVLPILITDIYLIFEKSLQKNLKTSKLKNTLLFLGIWCLETVVFYILSCILIELDLLPTIGGGFFDGVKYALLCGIALFIPMAIIAIWKAFVFAYINMKSKFLVITVAQILIWAILGVCNYTPGIGIIISLILIPILIGVLYCIVKKIKNKDENSCKNKTVLLIIITWWLETIIGYCFINYGVLDVLVALIFNFAFLLYSVI